MTDEKMMNETLVAGENKTGQPATLADRLIRNVDSVEMRHLSRAPLYDARIGRLAAGTAAQKLGASVAVVPPGKRACPYHLHNAQEEMFVVLEGSGSLRVAGEMLPIRSGDVIFIPAGADYPHQIINSSSAPLKYLSISTLEVPEICEYPDSGKYAAYASEQEPDRFDQMQRMAPNLDYWDGEP